MVRARKHYKRAVVGCAGSICINLWCCYKIYKNWHRIVYGRRPHKNKYGCRIVGIVDAWWMQNSSQCWCRWLRDTTRLTQGRRMPESASSRAQRPERRQQVGFDHSLQWFSFGGRFCNWYISSNIIIFIRGGRVWEGGPGFQRRIGARLFRLQVMLYILMQKV